MLLQIPARLANASYMSEQKKLGGTITIPTIPSGWFQGFSCGNMTPVWNDAGLPAEGIACFTIGAPGEDGVSSRFDPSSQYFQGYLGAYLFRAPESFTSLDEGTPNLNNLLELLKADMDNWLHLCGDKHPVTYLIPGTEHLHRKGQLFEAKMKTHVDLGPGNRSLRSRVLASSMRDLFSLQNSELDVPKNFNAFPGGSSAFEPIILQGYARFIAQDDLAAFVCGWVTESNFPTIHSSILKALLSAKIESL